MAAISLVKPLAFVLALFTNDQLPVELSNEDTNAFCRDGWTQFQGSCYVYGRFQVPWGEAAAYCLSTGAQLAVIETREENDFLRKMARDNNATTVRIGGTDVFKEGKWVWMSSGKSLGPFTDWSNLLNVQQPDNHKENEDCLELSKLFDYHWNDITCSTHGNFICEARVESEAGSLSYIPV